MTNLLPREKIYHVLGHLLGMCLTISIASCGGNQQSSFKPQKDKIENSSSITCDKVNDTIYMNFHSNMKQEDFDKEISQNPKLKYEKSIIGFNNQSIEFKITPTFNSCLTAINLDSEVQFGHLKSSDADEERFCSYIKSELEKKYGILKLRGDSSYLAPGLKNYRTEYDVRQFMREVGFDRETVLKIFRADGITKIINVSNWVPEYTYPGCSNELDQNGNFKSSAYLGAPEGKKQLTKSDLELEKRKPIDIVKSANFKSYITEKHDLELIIVTTFYTHQGFFGDVKTNTQCSRVIINYYSDRFWSEKKLEVNKKVDKKNLERLKQDSLVKANQDRL